MKKILHRLKDFAIQTGRRRRVLEVARILSERPLISATICCRSASIKGLLIINVAIVILVNEHCQTEDTRAMKNAVILEFPLHGVWITPNTPGRKIPSHGIDKYGETYAYDFVGVDEHGKSGNKFYESSFISYLLNGVPLHKCYGWGAEVYAPCDGEIVKIENGVVERNPVNLKNDLNYMRKITRQFEQGEAAYREVAGNHIILKCSEKEYALFAHLQMNSICVEEGQTVTTGQPLGRVGHSGNSTAPHLHFQLMDTMDPLQSKGIPCKFKEYEELENGRWVEIKNGIPSMNRIRKK